MTQTDKNCAAIEAVGIDQNISTHALFAETEAEAVEIATEVFMADLDLVKVAPNGDALYQSKIGNMNYIRSNGKFSVAELTF